MHPNGKQHSGTPASVSLGQAATETGERSGRGSGSGGTYSGVSLPSEQTSQEVLLFLGSPRMLNMEELQVSFLVVFLIGLRELGCLAFVLVMSYLTCTCP